LALNLYLCMTRFPFRAEPGEYEWHRASVGSVDAASSYITRQQVGAAFALHTPHEMEYHRYKQT
jgi:hypothetical protein